MRFISANPGAENQESFTVNCARLIPSPGRKMPMKKRIGQPIPCEGDEGDANAEEQAEEKEIAAAFLQKRKIRAAAAGITFHGVW